MFVCGTLERVKWYKEELLRCVKSCITDEEVQFTVGWYLLEGISSGIQKEWLLEVLADYNRLYDIAISLSEKDIQVGRKPPLFREGDMVEVIVNAKNITYHKGIIHTVTYHSKDREWNYFICENNKKVSKRYYAADLKLIQTSK
ncbi:hypothetical protein QTL86_16730 [Cellulosilyticum sp. ST5]|uniref:hypothetical protein n=1 Tax=Cellulosilyticum sp. ST5 TaxID=3055805 RepID=UPI00397725AA